MAHLVLLHFNGDDGSTTITNDGTSGSFTASGDAQLDTAQSKFSSSASLLLAGSATADYVEATSIGALPTTGSGWTMDGWFRFSSTSVEQSLFDWHNGISFQCGVRLRWFNTTQKLGLRLSSNGSTYDIYDGYPDKNTWSTDQWYHIAIVRDNTAGAYYLYVDGTLELTITTASQITTSAVNLRVGNAIGDSRYFNGWVDEFNVEDSCRYPGGTGFGVPTSEYVPPNEGTGALSLPFKTIYGAVNPGTGALVLPALESTGGVVRSGTGALTLPSLTGTGTGIITYSGTLDADVATPWAAFASTAYVGGSMSVTLPNEWALLETSALLGSTATMAAEADPVSSSFTAVAGPFGLDAEAPLATTDFTALAGHSATMKFTAPYVQSSFLGEGTFVATFAATAPLAVVQATALRGSTATLAAVGYKARAEFDAETQIVGSFELVAEEATSTFSGYSSSTATLVAEAPFFAASFTADSSFAYSGTVVMNTTSLAVSEYTNYGFNSFTEFNGVYLGASSTGIYQLDSTPKDEGDVDIDASFVMGDMDFGSIFQKRAPDVYAGIRSDGDVAVTVSADEQQTYSYTLKTYGVERLKQRRVKVGKGIKGKYFRFGVTNINGSDFELDTLDIPTVAGTRRV